MIDFEQLQKNEVYLQSLAKKLKRDFIGIDTEIEKIVNTISPWYSLNMESSQPYVMNLWGQTGTGKTDLVRRMSKYLNIPLIEMDLGSFNSDSAKVFGWRFYDKYSELSGKKCIILLDEFQKCETVSKMGDDKEPAALRDLWALLSDGMIPVNMWYDSMDRSHLMILLSIYLYGNDEDDAKARYFTRVKTINKKTKEGATLRQKHQSGEIVVDPQIIESISLLLNKSDEEVSKDFEKDPKKAAFKYLKQLDAMRNDAKYLNFKNALVIVCGNLDNVYSMSYSVSPDIDIDMLHKKSKEINIPEVKLALAQRFRPEQIARLGNNHIVYNTLSRMDYRKLIKTDIRRSHKQFRKDFEINFKFDESVIDIVYHESVYPSQGVRPIFSTIQSLIKCTLLKSSHEFYKRRGNSKEAIGNINYSFDFENKQFVFNHEKYGTFCDSVDLSLSKLTEIKPDDEKTKCAIHESGHALATMLLLKDYPEKANVYTPNYGTNGYIWLPEKFSMLKNYTRDQIEKKVMVLLAGRAAEVLVFGKECSSTGVSSDYQMATKSLAAYAMSYGMFDEDITTTCSTAQGLDLEISDKQREFVTEKLTDLYTGVYDLLNSHKKELLVLADRVLNNQYLLKKDLKQFSKDMKIDMSDPDRGFLKVYSEKIEEIKKADPEIVMGKMILNSISKKESEKKIKEALGVRS